MSKIIKDAIILTIITLAAGFGLGFVHDITVAPIEKANNEKKQRAYQAVMPGAAEKDGFTPVDVNDSKAKEILSAEFEKQTVKEIVEGKDDSGNQIGYVLTVISNQGFGGPIEMSIGVSSKENGKITGIDFLSMSESPGLGDNAKKPEFKDVNFKDKAVEKFKVVKGSANSDDEVVAITGATISSEAVTQGVNAALLYYKEVLSVGGAK